MFEERPVQDLVAEAAAGTLDVILGECSLETSAYLPLEGAVGWRGVVPLIRLGEDLSLFGPDPRHEPKANSNPVAMLLAGAHLLEHLNEAQACERIRRAVQRVLEDGRMITTDLGGTASAPQMTDAILAALPRR